jgi:hypothetical protein
VKLHRARARPRRFDEIDLAGELLDRLAVPGREAVVRDVEVPAATARRIASSSSTRATRSSSDASSAASTNPLSRSSSWLTLSDEVRERAVAHPG